MNDHYFRTLQSCMNGSQWLKSMKLTIALMIVVLLQVQARSYSQYVTLHEKNLPVEKLFKLIENQSNYHFLYDKLDIVKANAITVDVNGAPIEEVLNLCFKNQPLTYQIFQQTIVIKQGSKKMLAVVQQQVQGQVNDEQGQPLPGVSIKIKNAQGGTVTDAKGKFALAVPAANAVLVFSSIGFVTQEIPLTGQTTLTVGLKTESKTLSSVVVIGYGSQRKSDLTGSVVSIKSESLEQRPATNIEQQLSGKVSGVNVSTNSGRPGGNTSIVIRGANSVNSSNNPLYVVDGVILSNGVTDVSPISYLNPNDIESMNVLKDASATAIYGARGANGVILISTKRGSQTGGQINYSTYFSVSKMARKLDVLNSAEFIQVQDNSYKNAEKYDPVGFANGKYQDPAAIRRSLPSLFDANGNALYDTDWQKEASRDAFSQNHNLSFTGGNPETTYGLFMNYSNENGILRESYLKRYSGRFVFDSQIKKWMKVGGTLTFNNVEENRVDGGTGGLNVTRMLVETLPIVPVQYADGTYGSNANYPNMEGGENPVNLERNRIDILKTQTAIGNVYANINILKDLDFRSTLGINVVNQEGNFYSGRFLRQLSADYQGQANARNSRTNYWQSENYFTYNKKINENHSINAVLGISWQHSDAFESDAGTRGFTDDFYQYYNLGAGSQPLAPTSDYQKYTFNSYFGRVNYTYKDKYLVTVTNRVDGSSRFGSGYKYGNFPSGALAWRVSQEDFLKSSKTISNLKIRTSYGFTGNSEIGQYRSQATLGNSTAIFGGTRASGIGISALANPDLRWEKTGQFDAGFELGLFDNRIAIESDFYYKKTTNMLLEAPVPTSSGYSSIFKNIGSLSNKGFEFSITSANIKSTDFNWSTTFNIAINKSKVLALGEANDDIFPNPYFLSNTNIIRVGEQVGSFYGLVREGVWGTGEATQAATFGKKPGDIKHKDVNGDGQINDADRVILGKGVPTGYGTFSNTFKYKSFDLTVDIQYAYGNDVLNLSRHSGEDRTGQANSYATVLNGWSPTNQNTMIAENRPALAGYTTTVDSHMVEDASFIRGRNLLLGYNFSNQVTKKLKLNSLRVYASVQNFFLITKYTGYDPEVTTYADNFAQGIAFFDYPKPRVFLLGLNVSL